MAELKKVKAVTDGDSHWYVIPNDLIEDFESDLMMKLVDSKGFDIIYGKYCTNGDINNIQLFAEV